MTREERIEYVKRHVTMLSEHFDTVQIFVSRYDDSEGETAVIHNGKGNYYARYGHVKQWLKVEERNIQTESEE